MNEAELLFSEMLGLSRAELYLKRDLLLAKDKSAAIAAVLRRRINAEPLDYILGKAEFMGLDFKVTPAVLIPRPETEILVEEAAALGQGIGGNLKILDLGTGSGCIAITLAKILSPASIDAVDISGPALKVARQNAFGFGLEINFIQSDLFKHQEIMPQGYDLIVSNPPYVATSEFSELAPEVRQEPRLALDGGSDGLDFYRRIALEAAGYLRKSGYLLLEMGFGQSEAIRDIFQQSGELRVVRMVLDYQGIERVIIIQRKA